MALGSAVDTLHRDRPVRQYAANVDERAAAVAAVALVRQIGRPAQGGFVGDVGDGVARLAAPRRDALADLAHDRLVARNEQHARPARRGLPRRPRLIPLDGR
jgi:hypothetical protein